MLDVDGAKDLVWAPFGLGVIERLLEALIATSASRQLLLRRASLRNLFFSVFLIAELVSLIRGDGLGEVLRLQLPHLV